MTTMPFMVRFAGDVLDIALVGGANGLNKIYLKEFESVIDNFGKLRWKVNKPSTSVNFLNLVIKTKYGFITFKIHQMSINLNQCILQNSSHTHSMSKGIIMSIL